MKKTILGVLCFMFLIIASGCETIKGAARDVENTGKNLGELFRGEKFPN